VKILHIISSVNPVGGGPIEGVQQLGRMLISKGHTVEIASLDSRDAPFLDHSSLAVYPLGPGISKYRFSTKLIPWLRANRNRYDAVIVNGLWQYHSFAAWLALRKSNTPYVLYTHGMLDPWFKKQYPLKHLKKWLYWPWAEYQVLRDARAVLFTCEEECVAARSSFWLYQCNETVVSYGTSKPTGDAQLETQEFFARYPHLREKKLVLFLGRIHPKKGCDLLIEAFAETLGQNSEWHLIIAGPDVVGWQKQLNDRAAQLGLGLRITWTGMLSGAMKWGALRAAEVFVLPSHQENFGIAVVEALAVGVPVLISNKVNIWREIEADEAGIVAQDTLEGTSQLLQSYLEMPDKKRAAVRRRAVECFERRFEIKKAAETLHAVLARVSGMN
jgi:glycosyltransferase involved in cell wall biosynthesis